MGKKQKQSNEQKSMNKKAQVQEILKNLPRVDVLMDEVEALIAWQKEGAVLNRSLNKGSENTNLSECQLSEDETAVLVSEWGSPDEAVELAELERIYLKRLINAELENIRHDVLNGKISSISKAQKQIREQLYNRLVELKTGPIKRVVNGTGVILHTNLGRATVQSEGLDDFLSHYSNLEFNIETGERGSRNDHLSGLLRLLTGCEAAIAVNNNAAAVMLVLAALSKEKEAIISRGEQVEIGGSFRIPEVAELSGAILKEVGTTNKTRVSDYERAITDNTAMIIRVEPSNFMVIGQESRPTNAEIFSCSQKYHIPYYIDLGSGLFDIEHLCEAVPRSIAEKKLVPDALANADIVSFSGDKLLGSAQAGIIAGKKEYIDRLSSHPLYRAMRLDKATIYTLSKTLMGLMVGEKPLVAKTISQEASDVKKRVNRFLRKVKKADLKNIHCELIPLSSNVGGGTFAESNIKSYGISIKCYNWTAEKLAKTLRLYHYPIISMVSEDVVMLDFRTLMMYDEKVLFNALKDISTKR